MPRKSDALTGGTKDVNPQSYKLTIGTSGIFAGTPLNPFVQTRSFPVPINRLQQQGGKAVVMELLMVKWDYATATTIDEDTPPYQIDLGATLSTQAQAMASGTAPSTIDYINAQNWFQPANIPTAGTVPQPFIASGADNISPMLHHLDDGAGHGILIAVDNIFLNAVVAVVDLDSSTQYTGPANFNAATFVCELIYRFKEVTLQEYIGIVQSQSQNPTGS